jgi:asparagine synthase (glutamine-hydrolysing)
MCGITGHISFKNKALDYTENLSKSLKALNHRGPDNKGSFLSETLIAGHTRLKILDTSSSGNQPFYDSKNRYLIIFNGEIYNFKELKKQLPNINYKSTSDTEVLLYLYIKYGKNCIKMLNGFFAFAIYDKKKKHLFLARDRYGIKPLFYILEKNKLFFASELNAIIKYKDKLTLDKISLVQYLQFNYTVSPNSIFNQVKKLEPGHYISISKDSFEINNYYTLNSKKNNIIKHNADQIKDDIKLLLQESVINRLISDVPIGTFLSGGIDSSIITAIASKEHKGIKSFSIGFLDSSFFDETKYAEILAKKYKTNHQTFLLSKNDLIESMNSILDQIDEPFSDSSSIPFFALCKKTKDYVTVALSGDGADEIFSGYNKHLAEYRIQNFNSIEKFLLKFGFLSRYFSHSRQNKISNFYRKVYKLWKISQYSLNDRYWKLASFNSLENVNEILKHDYDNTDYDVRKNMILSDLKLNDFNSILITDQKLVLLNDMLRKVDSMSMLNSLEVRVPFLDHKLVNYVNGLEARFKISSRERKIILKEAFLSFLPNEILNRPKQGFELPLKSILMGDFLNQHKSLISKEFILEQNIFNFDLILKIIKKFHSKNSGDSPYHIWNLIVFQNWYNKNSNKILYEQ